MAAISMISCFFYLLPSYLINSCCDVEIKVIPVLGAKVSWSEVHLPVNETINSHRFQNCFLNTIQFDRLKYFSQVLQFHDRFSLHRLNYLVLMLMILLLLPKLEQKADIKKHPKLLTMYVYQWKATHQIWNYLEWRFLWRKFQMAKMPRKWYLTAPKRAYNLAPSI